MSGPSLHRIEGRLFSLGLASLLTQIQDDRLVEAAELSFATQKMAAMVQRLLYQWLTFYPNLKSRISLRLEKFAPVLTIMPKSAPERRGRRGGQ